MYTREMMKWPIETILSLILKVQEYGLFRKQNNPMGNPMGVLNRIETKLMGRVC